MFSTASTSAMLALQRRESGEEQDVGTRWDGFQLLGEDYASAAIDNTQQLINRTRTQDVRGAEDQQDHLPSKTNEVQSPTPRNRQLRPALKELMKNGNRPSQVVPSWPIKLPSSSQNGQQKTSCETSFAPVGADGAKPCGELSHTREDVAGEHKAMNGADGSQTGDSFNSKQAHLRGDNFNDSVVHALGGLRPFRRRKPEPWPNPRESLGAMIETSNKKIKGKVWVAEGPALELYERQIRPLIEKLLHNTEPPHCAPLLLALYMIGKSHVSASPIVMFCCCDRKIRRDAEAAIRESDILKQFPQIGLGNSATLLETNALLAPVTGGTTASNIDATSSSKLDIYVSDEPLIGRQLKLVVKANGRETIRLATGGPFLRIKNGVYQLTAFHMGRTDAEVDNEPIIDYDSDSDECEYDGQSDTDEEDGRGLEKTATKPARIKEAAGNTPETGSTLLSMAHRNPGKTNAIVDTYVRQDSWDSRTYDQHSSIDYVLMRLPRGDASKATNVIGKSINRRSIQVAAFGVPQATGAEVVVVTSHDLLTGVTFPGTKRVKLCGFHGFQDLLTADLSRPVKPGDSGSAVVDARTGCFYGHVIMGSAPDTMVYIVPSTNILLNAESRFGELPTLNLGGITPDEQFPGEAHQVKDCMDVARYGTGSDPQQLVEDDSVRAYEHARRQIEAVTSAGTDPWYRRLSPPDNSEPGEVIQLIWPGPLIVIQEVAPRRHVYALRSSGSPGGRSEKSPHSPPMVSRATAGKTTSNSPGRRRTETAWRYKCGWNGCEKTYGTINHLNTHVVVQSHGQKRAAEDMLPGDHIRSKKFPAWTESMWFPQYLTSHDHTITTEDTEVQDRFDARQAKGFDIKWLR